MMPPEPTAVKQADRLVGPFRFVAVLGVLSSITLSTLLFLSAAVRVFRLTVQELSHLGEKESLHTLVLAAVEQADILLIATALLIVGFGLYGLFVNAIANLPHWLRISSVDELKSKLLGVVVVALTVRFFAVAYERSDSSDLMVLGGAIGMVVLALAAFTFAHATTHGDGQEE
ncbi:YqhA family protein [Deinococcus hohokamensis]|uniref:YqhA family protein n=1 Tax=Deinococcus hohokamensis TaxID=309883 RepID=A0ABV9I5R7_9DEIO